uniref:Glycerophosphocholine acyltransferase 1 n=1 Tax=Chlamydomonas euryale TaxID=1486919 RepID=A0A7R9YS35_9CHLO|mmetsp:Transcript_15600/g.45987  ORF Transcript_15600/g.45987 Transcript_15600/m.45987 type:complete len:250 (+) Transcript_15600:331-1080(+)
METEFEDAESLGYDLGDFDSLVDLPEVLQAYYEAPDSFPSGEMAEALQRQQSQQHQQEPSADGAAHGCVAEGADAAVAEADGAAAGERSAGGTPHSHTLQDDNITDQLDKVDFGDFNFDLRLRLTFKKRWGPQHILLKDKLSFLLGSTLLWVCAFWLGHSPETFYRLYTVVGLALYVIRFFTYRRRDLHYYLFDFCYWANLLLMLHLWLWPNSELLQQTTFAFNTGPLTWTILAFRNSLVFHDLDKVPP